MEMEEVQMDRKRFLVWLLAMAAALMFAGLISAAIAQEHPEHPQEKEEQEHPTEQPTEQPEHPTEMSAQMETMAKLAAPGSHHESLAKRVGKWNSKGTFWMEPGADPIVAEGVAEISPFLDGRFILTDYKGDFMGMPFQGYGLDGYDNGTQKHIGLWVDNMGTMMMTYEGSCEQDGKVTTNFSEFKDPASGMDMKMKGVTILENDDKITYEAFVQLPDGNEFKVMEIVYTRAAE